MTIKNRKKKIKKKQSSLLPKGCGWKISQAHHIQQRRTQGGPGAGWGLLPLGVGTPRAHLPGGGWGHPAQYLGGSAVQGASRSCCFLLGASSSSQQRPPTPLPPRRPALHSWAGGAPPRPCSLIACFPLSWSPGNFTGKVLREGFDKQDYFQAEPLVGDGPALGGCSGLHAVKKAGTTEQEQGPRDGLSGSGPDKRCDVREPNTFKCSQLNKWAE